ncbi:thiamine pyrophosphate-dependent enzyme [Pseudophaeobacter sp.]|uniref:thiamine pyrophosphate-binding protein n=1 Tax=Pseudophaeobacter sp. TaxID=1971739 RepID=UPI003297DEFA
MSTGSRQVALRARLTQGRGRNGHQAIAAALLRGGITHVYSLAGKPMYATLGACVEAGLQVIGCRSQFGALSAALAHNYQAGAFQAIAMCSPAPGVTNSITSLSDAKENQWPMLLIAGMVEDPEDEGKGFQSFDGGRAASETCKGVIRARDRTMLPHEIHQALTEAQTAPQGPLFVEVGASVLNARHNDPRESDAASPEREPVPVQKPLPAAAATARQGQQGQKPLLVLGEGLRWSATQVPKAAERLRQRVEQLNLPVLATPMGRGLLPDSHRLSVFLAKEATLSQCDHLLLCGATLDWRLGGKPALSDPGGVQQVAADWEVLLGLLEGLDEGSIDEIWARAMAGSHQQELDKLRRQAVGSAETFAMNQLCEALGQWLPEDCVSIVDSGLGLSTGHSFWRVQQPFVRMTAGQNGTMGLGIPFALGAALQAPDRPVVALVGDVGFGLTATELETAVRHAARLIIVVADNGGINGRGFQDNWMPGGDLDVLRYSRQVDYAKVAEGWGARGVTVTTPQALQQALSQAIEATGPTVISVPMVTCFGDGITGEGQGNG